MFSTVYFTELYGRYAWVLPYRHYTSYDQRDSSLGQTNGRCAGRNNLQLTLQHQMIIMYTRDY